MVKSCYVLSAKTSEMHIECRVTATAVGDVPYWISRNDFIAFFDKSDARINLPKILAKGYLPQWFSIDKEGALTFIMPGIHFVKGKTEFFNGRHRTALLFEYLDELPFSFQVTSECEKRRLGRLPKRPVEPSDRLSIPDFPVWKAIPASHEMRDGRVMLSTWADAQCQDRRHLCGSVDPIPTGSVEYCFANLDVGRKNECDSATYK